MTSQHNTTEAPQHNSQHHCCPQSDSIQAVDSSQCAKHDQQETTTTTEVAVKPKSTNTEEQNLSAAFEVMGIGMAGIFLFMAIFFGMIKLMEKVFPAKD